VSEVTDTLAMLLYVGAARAAGTPAQVRAIQDRVLPAVADGRPNREVRREVRAIMGRTWRPAGEWAERIAALTG
jgi:hypothetical protein